MSEWDEDSAKRMRALTVELVTFLRDRLDEDEAAALAVAPGADRSASWYEPRRDRDADWLIATRTSRRKGDEVTLTEVRAASGAAVARGSRPVMEHVARHDPRRVLADVEARRALVGEILMVAGHVDHLATGTALARLAAPYVEHPDYQRAWSRWIDATMSSASYVAELNRLLAHPEQA